MKICIPYTENLNYFMNALCHECGIEFIMPPSVSRYTKEIGEAYGEKNMCSKVKNIIGSVAECFYLGADTALLFSSCQGCVNEDAERIASSLHKNGIKMKFIVFSPKKYGTDEFLSLLKTEFGIPFLKLFLLKKEMEECFSAMDKYNDLCIEILSVKGKNKDFQTFMKMGENELKKAGSVSSLKVVYKTLIKKTSRFLRHTSSPEVGMLNFSNSLPFYTNYLMRKNIALLGIKSRDISGVSAYFKKRKEKNCSDKTPSETVNSILHSAKDNYSNTSGILCTLPDSCIYLKLLKGVESEIERELNEPTLVIGWQNKGCEAQDTDALWGFYLRVVKERKNTRGAILFRH